MSALYHRRKQRMEVKTKKKQRVPPLLETGKEGDDGGHLADNCNGSSSQIEWFKAGVIFK